jgi:predicted amino acid racemase
VTGPAVVIDLDAIVGNARTVTGWARAHGAEVFGVTKATHGLPSVARALLRGGCTGLGESRIENVRRLRHGGIDAPVLMLRIPSAHEAHDVVELCDLSLNSERATLRALAHAAVEAGRAHGVIVMLELGDRREGVPDEELLPLCAYVQQTPGLELAGVGANFMCASGVLPTAEKLEHLVQRARDVEAALGVRLRWVSGGNSANLPLLLSGASPRGVNQLRVGAGILRGEDVLTGGTLPELRDDAFTLEGELVEIKTKPSLPDGETGPDAFGRRQRFEDRGDRVRGIVNVGRVDLAPEGLSALDAEVEVITASSDHLIVDLTRARRFAVGDTLRFALDYGALVQAMHSPYLEKRIASRDRVFERPKGVRVLAPPALLERPETAAFLEQLRTLGLQATAGGEPSAGELPLLVTRRREEALERITERQGEPELGVLWLDARPGGIETGGQPESTALVGLQEATAAESAAIHERHIAAYTMEDVDLLGIRETLRRALHRVLATTEGFVLVLNASVGRGMSEDPLEAGLSYRECSTAMERVAATGYLRRIALTGFDGDSPGEPLRAAYGYLLSALGKRILSPEGPRGS